MKYHVGMKKYSKRIAKLLLLSLAFNLTVSAGGVAVAPGGGSFAHVDEEVEEKGAINQFYAAYLKNRVGYERREEQSRQTWRSQQNEAHPELPPVWEIESTKLLMRYFEQNATQAKTENGAYFSANVYNDLNVFPDPNRPDKVTVFSDFSNLTNTMAGKLGLLEMLSSPLYELEKLRQRQRVIEFLYKNNTVFNQLDTALKRFGKAEKSMFYFLKAKDDGNNPDGFKRYFNDSVWASTPGWWLALFGKLIPAALAGGYAAYYAYQSTVAHNPQVIPTFPGLGWLMPNVEDLRIRANDKIIKSTEYNANRTIYDRTDRRAKTYVDAGIVGEFHANPHCGIGTTWTPAQHAAFGDLSEVPGACLDLLIARDPASKNASYIIPPTAPIATVKLVTLGLSLGLGYLAYRSYQNSFVPKCEMGKRFQSCMIDMSEIVEATKEIGEIVDKNESIASAVPGHKEAVKFISTGDDNDIKDLLALFESSAFKGDPSALGPKGAIFQAFGQMCDKADKFVELMRFVSRIDALMSVVKALRGSTKNKVHYSIPEFIKADNGKPYIMAKKFWHPTLNPNTAITNDIELGKEFRNVIITGANAGGKSTWMQALALVAVLAQTFGVVPAEQAALTPFAKVIVDVRVKDEIGEMSTYQAEMRKLTNAMQQIKSLPADKFAFYVVDEPLKGSNAEDCAKIGRGVIEDLGSNGNALLVVATHHPAFTEIAKVNDSFRNYRVHSILYSAEVENPATGVVKTEYAWKHTYKVVPGIEKNRFALVMMEEELAKSDLDFSASKDMLAGAR